MIDWQRVVLNLRSAGLSATAVARRVGSTPESVLHLARGEVADPRWSTGLKLLTLHHKICPEQHAREVYEHA